MNLRQTENWHNYLKLYNWEFKETSQGTKLSFLKTFMGYVTKIQRPHNIKRKELEEIINICRNQKNVLFIKIEPSMDQDVALLKEYGFQVSSNPLSPPSTIFIDLRKTEEELWDAVSRSGKYSIRRAKREGSTTKFIQNPSIAEVERFYRVVRVTSQVKRFYSEKVADMIEKRKVFKNDMYVGTVWDAEEKLMGVKFFLVNDDVSTFINGGTTPEGRKGKWGYDLLWESILYFKKQGFKYLDLEGVDDERFKSFTKGWGGFSYFKEKFGGEIVRFPPPHILYLKPELKILSKFFPIPF